MNKILLFTGCWIISLFASSGFANNYAFLSTAATVDAIQDDDEKAAAEWFVANYPNGVFITTSEIENATVDLSEFSVIWIHIDNNTTSDIPANFTNATVLTAVTDYYKAGGNLLLSGYATQYLVDLGRIDENRKPNLIGIGDGEQNLDIWGINPNIGMTYNYSSHPIYSKKVTVSELTANNYTFPIVPLISAGHKEDHNCMWDVNGLVDAFEAENNANVLATWEHVTDLCCAGIVEFLPTAEYRGSCIAVGVAAYEWNMNEGTNTYLDNIKKLTEGIFDYLNTDPATFVWGGRNGSDWADPSNWWTKNRNHNNASNSAPGSINDVIIPKTEAWKITNYPVVPAGGAQINTITFLPGAEIGNQTGLTHNEATVRFELSETGRWHMLTMPVGAKLSDFQFNRNPSVWLLKFIPDGVNTDWTYITQGTHPSATLAIGEGFAVSVDKNRTEDFPIHVTGKLLTGASNYPVNLTFGEDNGSAFALVGNPFMASIDFSRLYSNENNSDIIKNNYLVWTKSGEYSGFKGYLGDANDDFGIVVENNHKDLDKYIAPLQAFFVERKDENAGESGSLIFDLSYADIGKGELRSATSGNYAKLDITAENGTVPVKTFISNKEEAVSALKLKDGCGDIPDIYTLNETRTTAFGAQIINTNQITVPLGIATEKSGDMHLTFSGMSSYTGTEINLIDKTAGKTIPLTGDFFRYDFEYTPPAGASGNVIADENRFEVVFSPKAITGIEETAKQNDVSVYTENNAIYAAGSSGNLLLQLVVYDVQGRIVYAETNLNVPEFTISGLLSDETNIYLIKIISENGVKNVKLINR